MEQAQGLFPPCHGVQPTSPISLHFLETCRGQGQAHTALKSSFTSNLPPLPPRLPLPFTFLPLPSSTSSPPLNFRFFPTAPSFRLAQSTWRELMADRRSPLADRAMSWRAEPGGRSIGFGVASSRTRRRDLEMNVGAKGMKLGFFSYTSCPKSKKTIRRNMQCTRGKTDSIS